MHGIHTRMIVWLRAHVAHGLWVLGVLAFVLRVILVTHAPADFGYVYDPYHLTVIHLDQLGHLPDPRVDPESWQPPLFYYVGWVFYRSGRFLSGGNGIWSIAFISTICNVINLFYCYRILRYFRVRGEELIIGMAIAFAVPVAFIGSFAAEADYLLATLMIAASYHLLTFANSRQVNRLAHAVGLGILSGLCMATKYSGLIALVLCGLVCGLKVLGTRHRMRAIANGLIILAIALTIGSWRYVDNYRIFHTPLHASGSALAGFAIKKPVYYWDHYDFWHLRLGQLFRLYPPNAPAGHLADFSVYSSVWTSLHAQGWSDMSFFTEPTRHGYLRLYQPRGIPSWLPKSILILALLPNALAVLGLVAAGYRGTFRLFAILVLATLVVYFNWVLGQTSWAIKTKYILFLLPAYILFMVMGLRSLNRWAPPILRAAVMVALAALVLLLHGYLFQFARGLSRS